MLPELEEIESLALKLLRKEPESDRPGLLRWAANELEKVGLDPHLSTVQNDTQACHDLIGSNMGLPDWMTARDVYLTNLLQAEDFRDLIDRLTPAMST